MEKEVQNVKNTKLGKVYTMKQRRKSTLKIMK